jgi:hypothetical protein
MILWIVSRFIILVTSFNFLRDGNPAEKPNSHLSQANLLYFRFTVLGISWNALILKSWRGEPDPSWLHQLHVHHAHK